MHALDDPLRAGASPSGGRSARLALRLINWAAWLALAVALALGCAYLLLRHVIWPDIDRWRPQIERLLSGLIDAPVSIGELQSGFDGLRPSLRARAIKVGSGEDAPLAIEQAYAVVSLRSLLRGSPSLVAIEIERPVVRVERLDRRRFVVAGALVDIDKPGRSAELGLVLASRSFSVRNARFDWHDRLGSEPMVIAGVDLHSASEDGQHHLSMRAPAIGSGLQGLELAIDFRVAPGLDPTDWRGWRGEAYASALQVQFAPLWRTLRGWQAPEQGSPARVLAGSGPIKTWLRFDEGRLVDALIKTFTEAIDLTIGGSRVALRSLTLEANLQPGVDDRLLVLPRRVSAVDSEGFAFALDERASHRVEFELGSGRARSGQFTLRGFDAARLLHITRRLAPAENWTAPLARLALSGRISSAGLRWDLEQASYSVSLGFERLSARRLPERGGKAPETWPSFANLSGRAEFDDRSGRLHLDSTGAVLRFPGDFAEPALQFSSIRGDLAWTLAEPADSKAPRLASVHAQALSFSNADLAGELNGSWRAAGRSARGEIDIAGKLERANAARVVRYLPLALSEPTRLWVARAIGSGSAASTLFELRGDLADFPFREPALGTFRIETRLDQVALAHTPGWPLIERIRGGLLFERAGMAVNVESAEVLGVRIGPVQARIEDFAKPVLLIEGEAGGTTRQMLRVLEQSPLRARVAEPLASWEIEGASRLGLSLDIGLSRGAPVDWRGTVDVRDNRLRIEPALPWLESVNGRIGFDPSGVWSRDPLTASALGGQARWHIAVPSSGTAVIDAHGDADAATLAAFAGGIWRNALRGQFDWRGSLRLEGGDWRGRLESSLKGMESALPEPLAKTASEEWPLNLAWLRLGSGKVPSARASHAQTLGVVIGREIRGAFEQGSNSPANAAWRGALGVGTEPSMPGSGLALDLRTPALDADAWQRWFEQSGSAAAVARAAESMGSAAEGAAAATRERTPPIERVSLITPSLTVGGKAFTRVVLGATLKEDRWQASLSSAEMEGHLEWLPPGEATPAGAVSGKLAVLRIGRSQQRDIEALLDKAPKRLPALDIQAERLVLAERELGRLSLRAENAADGEHPTWRLQRLRVEHPGATLDAQGVWEAGQIGTRATVLDFVLDVRDSSRTLETFGIRGALSAGAPARLGGTLRWRGSPLAIDYPTLSGQVDVQVGKGQFLKTEPGLGKLIGVLNLQSLPRRLSLDFRDVFAEGFSFDDISGRATIAAGIARTDDFRMRGVQAQVRIRGEANLAEETQRLRVEVRPELNAGLASLAYAAMANPAIGLGSFLAQWALRKPLQDMFSYEYEVVGTWADPSVTERARPRFDAMAEELKRPVSPGAPTNGNRATPPAPR